MPSPSHIFSRRLALPLKILVLSSAESWSSFIHFVPGTFCTKGQSTENRIRSTPSSIMEQSSAGVEKLPLVVI